MRSRVYAQRRAPERLIAPGGRTYSVQFLRAGMVDDGLQNRRGPYVEHGQPVMAGREIMQDSERFAASAVGVEAIVRFVVRYSALTASITHSDRMICDGRTYAISGIRETGFRRGFEITAAEVRE